MKNILISLLLLNTLIVSATGTMNGHTIISPLLTSTSEGNLWALGNISYSGWYRIARSTEETGSSGKRGGVKVTVTATGNWLGPSQQIIYAFKNWTNTLLLSSVSDALNAYFTKYRIVIDNNIAYIEGYLPSLWVGDNSYFHIAVESIGATSSNWTAYNEALTMGLSSPIAVSQLDVMTNAHTFSSIGVAGKLGIGTSNPEKKLDVWSPANEFSASFGNTIAVGQWSGIHFGYKENSNDNYKQAGIVFERTAYNNAAPGKIHLLNSPSHHPLTLESARFTVDEIGRIGIGTRSPTKKLDVWSENNAFSASFGSTLGVGQWSGIHFGYKEEGVELYKQAGIVFERTAYNNAAPGKIHFLNTTSAGSATLADSKVTIDELGNMGVGTASPFDKLTVHGNISLTYGENRYVRIGSATNYYYNLQSTYNDFQIIEAADNNKVRFHISYPNGNIGIGTTTPTEKLSVNGNIKSNGTVTTKKLVVSQTNWPDYVFDSSYTLRSLSAVEKFITQNKRLPDMPSAKEVAQKGISVGDNQALLLKKIEELTLYVIELKKENIKQQEEINALKKDQ